MNANAVPARMDSLLDTAPCGYVSLADDGAMLLVNHTLAAMLGYAADELRGAHLEKILAPGGRIFYQTHVFPLLRLHGIAEEMYVPLRTRGGEDVPMLMNAARRERDGVSVNDCVFVRMIQRHEFEDQLLQARRAAEEASAAKAKFLSMMSHDLRTPLTSISGHSDLLAAGAYGPATHEQREAMAQIKEACRELLRMINDILSFAQMESGRVTVRRAPVPVSGAIARAEALVRLRLQEAGLTLVREGCEEGTVVSGDADRLQQILLNLLTNAIKFTASGGRITVSCDQSGDHVRIRIRDTGVGIPQDQLERVFDPFVQLEHQPHDPAHRGVGLGLAISRELTRAMGGELTADSTPGEGSVFTIDLPADSSSDAGQRGAGSQPAVAG